MQRTSLYAAISLILTALISPVSPSAADISLGVYLPYVADFTNEITAFNTAVSKQHAIVAYALTWDGANGATHTTIMNQVKNARATPMCIWGRGIGTPSGSMSYAQIAAGAVDPQLRDVAQAVAAFGDPVIFTLDAEFNNKGASPSCYVNDPSHNPSGFGTMWRHVVDVFNSEGAVNVQWAWVPVYQGDPNDATNQYNNYWPGSAYVDWVGTMGFDANWADPSHPGAAGLSFNTMFSAILADFTSRYSDKPQMIEWFATAGNASQKPTWIAQSYSAMASYANLRAVVWFNDFNGEDPSSFDFRVWTTTRPGYPPVPATVTNAYGQAISPASFLSVLPPYDQLVPGGGGGEALTITVTPSTVGLGQTLAINYAFNGIAQRVDAYLGVEIPGGTLYVMNPRQQFQLDIVPIAANYDVSGNPSGRLDLTVPGNIAPGLYTFEAVCVPAGSSVLSPANWLGGGLVTSPVTVQ